MNDHLSILVEPFLSFFSDRTVHRFIDGTLGAGGHARFLLEAHPEIERFFGFDRDPDALEIAKQNLNAFQEKVTFIHANFLDIPDYVNESVEGIFLDLGVSSMQLDRPEKGFSFSHEGPLDMRMDPTKGIDAETVVNSFPEKELAKIIYEYGEEPRSRAAAKAIVAARRRKRLKTTTDLAEALKHALTWRGRKGKKIHPATLVFQALRIYVNNELQGLKEALPKAFNLLVPGGRLGVISFHSLEDRIVKQTFRHFALEKRAKILTKKPIIPDYDERCRNPRSRSAKMRFIERVL